MTLKVPGEFQTTEGTCAWCGSHITEWISVMWCDDCCDKWIALPLEERRATTPREYFTKLYGEAK